MAEVGGKKTSLYDMVLEALTETEAGSKGVSVHTMKTYLMENFDVDASKVRLKKALAKGLEAETIIRPKGSDDLGDNLNGRFKLNKVKIEKDTKAKEKAAAKKAAGKPASAAKSPGKAAQLLKSPKVAKSLKAKTSPKAIKSVKSLKSPKTAAKKALKSPASKGKSPKTPTKRKTAGKAKIPKVAKTPSQKAAKAKVKRGAAAAKK